MDAWPGKVYDRSKGRENGASVRTDGRRGEDGDTVAKRGARAKLRAHLCGISLENQEV